MIDLTSGRVLGPVHHRRSTCRLCDGSTLEQVLALTPTPPANALVPSHLLHVEQTCFPLDVYLCHDCKHVQLLDVVDPQSLFKDYVYVSGTSPANVKYFREYAEQVIRRGALKPGDLVVEVGSNDGTMLRFFKNAGMRVVGIDPAQAIAARATEGGVHTVPEFFTPAVATRIRETAGPASVICANNVCAHIDDLAGVLEGVRTLLAGDGFFVFEVSYLLDVYERTLFDTIYHEHLDYHTIGPLNRFFEKNGMRLCDALRTNAQGGSLRGYGVLTERAEPVRPSVMQLERLERAAGLEDAATFRKFAQKIRSIGGQLTTLLKGLKSKGKHIAGYGAPAKATTLMYHFGLDRETIEFIVEDNPLKHYLFTPGLHVPIFPVEEVYARKPDYVVVLAWNFADSIIAKHTRFAKSGGRFVVPLPKLRVL